MFNIAIFGSNSQISKDLIPKLLNNENIYLNLFQQILNYCLNG